MKALIATALLLSSVVAFADTVYVEPGPRRVYVEPEPRRVVVEPRPYLRDPGWELRAARRERNAGMVMTIVGVPFVVASVILATTVPQTTTRYDHDTAVTGAVLTGVTAGLLIIPGIPLWADGQARLNALEGRRLSLQGGPAGSVGSTLALAF
jgi:hypothetical protein